MLLALLGNGTAQQAAVIVDQEGTLSGQPYTVGWEFEVDSPIAVSALGRILPDLPTGDSNIRLYELETGVEIGSLTIPQTAPTEPAGAFYLASFADLATPLSLTPGIRYLIAVEALDGVGFLQDTPATLASPIRFIQGRAADLGLPLPATASTTTFPIERNVSGASYLGPTFRFTNEGGGADPLTSLQPRSVFQRDESSGNASIPISGTLGTAPVTRIEARAIPTDGGIAVDWTTIDSNPSGGTFNGNLTISGGRYRIEARAFDASGIRYEGSASLIGVGDVYVIARQSNAANFGETLLSAIDNRVSTVNLETNVWLQASDLMPNAGGIGGSPWPRLGDLLTAQENVPIAVIAVAQGGTTVSQWLPGGQLYTQQLLRALTFTKNNSGLRAILWHQGETDAASGTSESVYAQRLQTIIAQSRIDAEIDLPWGVALASADPGTTAATEAEIIAGQQRVIAEDALVFEGASTNDFGSLGLLYDGVRFSTAGLEEHAIRWSQQISTYFGSGGGSRVRSALLPSGEGTFIGAQFTTGWEFTVEADTNVTRLGRVIPLGSALGADSLVAIYRLDAGEIVASANVSVGTTGEPLSGFHQSHYAPLPEAITLTPGINHVILAEALDGSGFYQDVAGTVATGINYVQGRATAQDANLPTSASDTTLPIARNETGLSYLGATFEIEGSAPPPPPPSLGVVRK